MAKYLNDTGLSHLMTKVKTWAAATFAPLSHTHDYTKTRVKGNAESSYRTGDVNLTPANIGAVAKSGDTMTGNLVVPKTRIANTYYGVSFGRTTETPVETILYTGIKWASSAHMPVIHVTGYAYGLQSPVEFKIAFYIYGDKIGWCGATNMGSWNPSIKLFKHTVNSVDYVAVGFSGSCYYLQLQVDVQDEMGKFLYTDLTNSLWSWSFLTTAGTIPEADGGVTCIAVPYKADILVPNMANASGTLPISHGGTGATTAADAWTALGGGAIGKKASLAASDIPAHASTATTYGAASTTNYGHVKLSDSTSASTDTTGGTAATPKAVKAAYDLATTANSHATDSSRLTTAQPSGLYKMATTAEGHVASVTAVQKSDITGLGIPGSDTHYASKNVVGSSSATSNTTSALTNGNVYLNSVENGAVTSAHKISGTDAVTVTTDASGNILVNAHDTTYSSKAASAGGTDVSLVTTGEKATWNSKTSNTGTVTKVSTGAGLTGGTISTSGTLKAKLRSETLLSNDSAAATEVADRVYPVALDKSGYLCVNVPWEAGATVTPVLTAGTKIATISGTDLYSPAGCWYGSCSTTASTQAKAVTCSGFTLVTGARIKVYFSVANTYVSGAVQLNVNSTGAKSVYVNGATTSDTNRIYWPAGAYVNFVYNGSYWFVDDQPEHYYGSCSTAAGTAAKSCSIAFAVVRKGTKVTLQMSYAHTSSTAATLNICNNTSTACTIYNGASTVTSANNNSWAASSPVTLMFDGKYWRMTGSKVTWGELCK